MKYQELKAKHKAEVDAFPFGFAFNQKQIEEMMFKWGFINWYLLSEEEQVTLHTLLSKAKVTVKEG